MSLDKNRILSELGSVMNQLQSADCGCMGKLFSNSGQGNQSNAMGSLPTCGGCRRGYCNGHGYGNATPNSGEPYPGNMNRPCMGHCNPPKLYADTYSYLNNHVMQPVVQEVYNDLKTITPANTVMNNPMANKMGLGQNVSGLNMMQNNDNQVTAGNIPNQIPNNMPENMNSMPIQQTLQPMNNIGGMGPEIAKMILGESGPKQNNPQMPVQGRQLEAPMMSDVRQSPHGTAGMNPASQMYTDFNQGQYTSNQNQYTANINQGQYRQPTPQQYMPNSTSNTHNNLVQGNILQNRENTPMGNSAAPQIGDLNQRAYGQHNQGVMKFNQMFPGVMQGGDLGFDPMAIAIQMNPANQQKAAMDTMQKLMNGTPINKAENLSAQPATNMGQPTFTANAQNQNYSSNNQQFTNHLGVPPNQNLNQQIISTQQQIDNTNAVNNPITTTQHSIIPQHQQQVYSVVTDSNQQQTYQKSSDLQNQPMTESEISTTQPNNLGINNLNTPMHNDSQSAPPQSATPETQQITRDPILPVDTSRNQPTYYVKPKSRYEFNTLGQPVQMLPAQVFHEPEPRLPQTLSPQAIPSKLRNNQNNYSNVKSTVSKTSIIGKGHVPRAVSKSQLQHLYNQYKGSQSFTQQNVMSPVQAPTHSDGKLNIAQPNTRPQQLIPVEKFGGDNNANNVSNNIQIPAKVQKVIDQIGDVPLTNKPKEDIEPVKASPAIPTRQAKLRNGLQDVVYTSYPSSAAWSFHGANDYRPVPARYRFREFK